MIKGYPICLFNYLKDLILSEKGNYSMNIINSIYAVCKEESNTNIVKIIH